MDIFCLYLLLLTFGLTKCLSGFLRFWALVFTISTTLVALLKHENEEVVVDGSASDDKDGEEIGDLGVVDTYKYVC